MKIDVCKEVQIETTVTIDSEDIEQVLTARLVELTEPDVSERFLLSLCNDLFQVLKAITPQMIARVREKNRRLVYDGLSAQVARWEPLNSCEHGVLDGEFCEPCNKEYKRAASDIIDECDRCGEPEARCKCDNWAER